MDLEIIIILQDYFLPLDIVVKNNLIYIKDESKTLHTFDLNYLTYLYENNEINKYLKELIK